MPSTNVGDLGISIEGFAELAEALANLSDPASVQEALGSATFQGGIVVMDEAKRLAPVDTGKLRDSYGVQYGEVTTTSTTVEVGTPVPYGKYVELGTAKASAQPHLRPALDSKTHEVIKVVTDTFVELAHQELQNRGPRGGVRRT